MKDKEIKKIFDELDGYTGIMDNLQKPFYLNARQKFYTDKVGFSAIPKESLQTLLMRMRMITADIREREAKAAQAVPPALPAKDENKELFDSLFAFQRVMKQSDYMYLVCCHKSWKDRIDIWHTNTLSWQERKDLHEMRHWYKSNYPTI